MPKRSGYPIITLQQGHKIYEEIKKKIKIKSYIAGSIRRNEPIAYDIDIIIIPNSNNNLLEIMSNLFTKIHRFGDKIINGTYIYKGIHVLVDFFITTKEELPYSLLQYTGPKSYVIRIRKYVKQKYNYKLNQYGLFYATNNNKVKGTSHISTEKELINFIGTTYYLPENRK
jgi:DNA polymerase/3'-5' exonuclease PolX